MIFDMSENKKLCDDSQMAEFITKVKATSLEVIVEENVFSDCYKQAFIENLANLDEEMFIAFESTTGLCFVHTCFELFDGENVSEAKLVFRKTELIKGVMCYEGQTVDDSDLSEDLQEIDFDEPDEQEVDPNAVVLKLSELNWTVCKLPRFG